MAKWHVNPETGNAGICRSGASQGGKPRGCPFGDAFHGDSREQCEEIFAEEMLGTETFLTGAVAGGSPRSGMVRLEPNLTAEERRARITSIVVDGSQVPPMSFASDEPIDLGRIDGASNPATTTVPDGGLWLARTKDGGSDWTPSLKEYRGSRGAVVSIQSVEPRADAKILRIDSYENLVTAMAAYPGTERGWRGKSLDVDLLRADGYDGIYLTRRGFLDTRPHPDDDFQSSYSPGQESGRTEISAQRINTHGWVPSAVLFSRDAVGRVGNPQRAHRDGAGKSLDLMAIGERGAAAKYGSIGEFVRDQKDDRVLALVTKYRVKKSLSVEQVAALEIFKDEAASRGYSQDALDESYVEAKRDAYLSSSSGKLELNRESRKRIEERGLAEGEDGAATLARYAVWDEVRAELRAAHVPEPGR